MGQSEDNLRMEVYARLAELHYPKSNPTGEDGACEKCDPLMRISEGILMEVFLEGFLAGLGHSYKDCWDTIIDIFESINE